MRFIGKTNYLLLAVKSAISDISTEKATCCLSTGKGDIATHWYFSNELLAEYYKGRIQITFPHYIKQE
jgi:hypothetical protein